MRVLSWSFLSLGAMVLCVSAMVVAVLSIHQPVAVRSPAPDMPRPMCHSLVVGPGYWDPALGMYHEYGCARPQHSAAALWECLRGKSLLFLGNSHLRDVLRELLDFLGLKSEAHAIDSKYRHSSYFTDPSTATHVMLGFVKQSTPCHVCLCVL